MGYTHYWTPKEVSAEKFKEFADTCKELKKNLPEKSNSGLGYPDKKILIRGGNGTGKPIFKDNIVSFNGDLKRDMDHETFYIEHGYDEWNFCKTARKPYDLLVCACLIAAHEILGYEVSSDGGINEWTSAIKFYLDIVYGEMVDDEDSLKAIIPTFLFDEQVGSTYNEPYNLMDHVKSLFEEV